jgi:predicted aspartyl protease
MRRRSSARSTAPAALLFLLGLLASACDIGAPATVRIAEDSTAAGATADRAAAAAEVPFRLAGPNDAVLLVAVHINGEGPFDFVLDTGATVTCVDATLTSRLALEPEAGRLGFGLDATRPGQVQLIRMDSLRLGAATAVDLGGCVLDLAHIQQAGLAVDGLLGLNFLKSFTVTIDFHREVLTLARP